MSKLSVSDVNHVSKLSKIVLTEDEKINFSSQLSNILSYVDKLQEVEVVASKNEVSEREMNIREDIVDESLMFDAKSATHESKNVYNNMFVVDMVLSERSDEK